MMENDRHRRPGVWDMEPADLGQHISRRFNEDMERVRTRVMQMGGFVEQQLQRERGEAVQPLPGPKGSGA